MKKKCVLNQKGFTLVEVMVSVAVLMLAVEIISMSVSFSLRMNAYSRDVLKANAELGKKIQEERDGDALTAEITVNGYTFSGCAHLYSVKVGGEDSDLMVRAMWADDTVLMAFDADRETEDEP